MTTQEPAMATPEPANLEATAEPAAQTYGPFERRVHWKTWWVWLWVIVATGLLAMIVLEVSFKLWLPAAVIGFGTLETIGMLHPHDPYPPLTQVIRQYVPRWLAFTLIYFFVGLGAGTWLGFDNRWGLAAIVGLLGWLTTHFDLTFDHPAADEERTKYQWYADKLNFTPAQKFLANRQPKPTTA